MTIHLGPIDEFVVHYGAMPSGAMPNALCRFDQTASRTLSTFTTDWPAVTCQSCIEWRHA